MNLFKASFLNGIAVTIKMLTLLGVNKVLAIYVGPTGYASIGQLQNIISVALAMSSGGINSGVVKYTAQYNQDDVNKIKIWKTSVSISFFLTLITSTFIIIFSNQISEKYLFNSDFNSILISFGVLLYFFAANNILLSIINGLQKTQLFIFINILSSLFSFVYTIIFVYAFGLYGALIALISNQAILISVTVYFIRKNNLFEFSNLIGLGTVSDVKELLKFSIMVLLPSLLWPICYTYIRGILNVELGLDYAGSWDAMWKLSNVYLTVVTLTLGIYFLPLISRLRLDSEVKAEVLKSYKFILPLSFVLCSIVYLGREHWISILFSAEFNLMLELFKWQVLGDFVKIITWLMSYCLLAKAMTIRYLFVELFCIFSFSILVPYFVDLYGFEGVAIAHLVNNVMFFIIILFVFIFSSLEDQRQ